MTLLTSIRQRRLRINHERLLEFSGINQYIDLGVFQPLNYSGSFSISFIGSFTENHPNGGGTVSTVFNKTLPVGSVPIRIVYGNAINQFSFIIDTNAGQIQPPNVNLQADKLYHIVCSWNQDTGELRTFINGSLASEIIAEAGTTIDNTGTEKSRIGSNAGAGSSTQNMSGRLNNFLILNRAVTIEEVNALFVIGGVIPASLHDAVLGYWPLTQKTYERRPDIQILASITDANNLVGYWDFDFGLVDTSDGAYTGIFDISGNDNHVISPTSLAHPKRVIGGINGFDYAEFQVAHYLNISSFNQGLIPQPFTYIAVFRQRDISGSSFSQHFSAGDAELDVSYRIRYGSASSIDAGTSLPVSDPPGAPNDFIVVHIEFDGANSALYYNNNLDASGDAGSNGLDGIRISRSNQNPDMPFFCVLGYKPDNVERTNIYNELKSKYNL